MEIGKKLFVLLVVVVLSATAFGVTYNFTHAVPKQQTVSGPYKLTLVVTTNNYYNGSAGQQPVYYVLNNGSLQSSAYIQLPADQNIQLTIINYDDGPAYPLGQPGQNAGTNSAGVAALYNVTGTVGNVEKVINDTNVNSTLNGQIQISGGQTVSNLADFGVSHTFTVSQLGLNVPLPPTSTVVTNLYFTHQGTYQWQCEAPCGSGPTGWGGAMSTAGWMMGTINVVLY